MFAQRIKLFEINPGSSTIQLHHSVRKDDENHFFKRMKEIKTKVWEFEREFLTQTFSQLFFSKYKTNMITFHECNLLFTDLSKNRKIAPKVDLQTEKKDDQEKNRSIKQKSDLFFETRTGSTEVSDPRLKSPQERWIQVADLIELKKIEMGIWISKIKRDHNIDPKGRIDEFSDLFKKLVDNYNLTFSNRSGYDKLVGKNDGNCFTMTMNKTGHISLWVNQTRSYYDWALFIKQFYSEFRFLTFEEQSQLLECFEYARDRLFILETANTIGPKPLIDLNWKGACVVCKRLLWKGKFHDILVWIDYSKGEDPEIEFNGPEEPCRLMQELLTMPLEIAESMGRFESILEEFLTQFEFIEQSFMDLAQTISKNQTEIIAAIDDSRNQESDHFSIITNNQKGIITSLDDRFNNVDGQLQQIYDQQDGYQIQILDSIHDNHEIVIETVDFSSKKVLAGVEVLDQKISGLDEKLDNKFNSLLCDLEKLIDSQNQKFKANLYLVLRAISKLPGQTADILESKLNMKKSTLYRYLQVLQDNNLVLEKKRKTLFKGRGRPKSEYHLF
jgi:hypothetical protein